MERRSWGGTAAAGTVRLERGGCVYRLGSQHGARDATVLCEVGRKQKGPLSKQAPPNFSTPRPGEAEISPEPLRFLPGF